MSWWEPISATRMFFGFTDPLILRAKQFGGVVRGKEPPAVTGRDGLATLAVVKAAANSAVTGATVEVRT